MSPTRAPSTALSASIADMLRNAVRITWRDPRLAWYMLKQVTHQRRAARVRQRWDRAGTHVPPLIMNTVTGQCNLHCAGCYARAQGRPLEQEMSPGTLRSVVAQADELGVGVYLITGGEPFTRPDLLDVTAEHPRMLFPVFTNGLLIDAQDVERLAQQRHVVPLISLEGAPEATDARRGAGVHAAVLDLMRRLSRWHVLFGASVTVTRENMALVTSARRMRAT